MKIKRSANGFSLIAVLVVCMFSIFVITTAVALILSASQSVTDKVVSESAVSLAESAAEDAILKLLRNPQYAGGGFTLEDGQAVVSITNQPDSPVVAVVATRAGVRRKLTIHLQRVDGSLEIQSWKEE